jgi:hypothetical protein
MFLMAGAISLTCPKCGKKVTVRAELEGKKIRCKECKTVYPVTASAGQGRSKNQAKAKTTQPAPVNPPLLGGTGDDSNPYGVTDHQQGYRCPVCANEMEGPEAIICLHCGFNTQTREASRTRHIISTTGEDKFVWLLPGILAVIAIPVMIVIWVLYHFCLPYWIFGDKWDEVIDLPRIDGSRNKLAGDERLGPEVWPGYSYLFHYGVEVWLIVAFLFLTFLCTKFAIQRLILHPEPPEKEK